MSFTAVKFTNQLAKVLIGMPVFNGAQTIARSIKSVMDQEFSDWNLTVSDNASRDDTVAIVESFLQHDSRIKLVSRESTISALNNFSGLTKSISAPYFVFLASDDAWEPDFLSSTFAALESNPQAVLATGQVQLGDQLATGTYPILDELVRQRINRYLRNPSDNSRYYGLMRSSVVQSLHTNVPAQPFFGLDWFQMAQSLRLGKHLEIPRVLLHRGASPLTRYFKMMDSEPNRLFKKFPAGRLSLALFRTMPCETLLSILPLLKLNVQATRTRQRLLREAELNRSVVKP